MTAPADINTARAKQWKKGLLVQEKTGEPKRLIANVLHVMARHPAWLGVLAFDEFTTTITKLKAPPTREQDGAASIGEWTEADTSRTRAWFASEVGFEPSASDVEQAVDATARNNAVHPVRAYLRALSWDGTPRLDGMLADYFGARATPYTQSIGAKWMISAVARVMSPGCQVDCMVVLEGPQGVGKSTGLAALAGPAWFADTGVHVGDKDSYQALRGKWLYEFGEMAAIKGREVERVKSFVSARVDTYRPSYGRRTIDFHRQCVFAGTTNEAHYLADGTGNRRFWPIACGVVDVARLRDHRDQLWAEALHRYENGERWHVDTPELRTLCHAEQTEREIEDPWLVRVREWLALQREKGAGLEADGVTTNHVLADALEVRTADMSQTLSTRVGGVLRKLGWEPRQRRVKGNPSARERAYFPASQPVTTFPGVEA